jgi:hypothetical protein
MDEPGASAEVRTVPTEQLETLEKENKSTFLTKLFLRLQHLF